VRESQPSLGGRPLSNKRSERRRYGRFPVSGILGTLKRTGDLKLLDLSRNGICFETSNPITVGGSYFLELRYGQATVNLEVLVKWCAMRGRVVDDEGNEEPVYQAGAGFVDVHRDAPGGLWRALEAES
jgi:hypothetical protein